MSTKCVLFDADGVIINSDMFSVLYQKKYDISIDVMLPFFKGDFQDCIIGKADLKKVIKKWLPKWKWNGTVDGFLQFWFKAEHHLDERIVLMIKKLRKKGIKCYLVTNQEKYRTQYLKDYMGFEELFDEIYSSNEIGYKKPEKEFYEYILEDINNKYNINPQEIMFFDDSLENINEAKKLNIDSYLYEEFEDFKKIIKPIFDNKI